VSRDGDGVVEVCVRRPGCQHGVMGDTRRRTASFWSRNALSLTCFAIFAVALLAQGLTGWRTEVADATQHGEAAISFWTYLTTSHFYEATFENWRASSCRWERSCCSPCTCCSAAQASPSRRPMTLGTRTPDSTATTGTLLGRCDAAASGSTCTSAACSSPSACCSPGHSLVTPSPAHTSTPPNSTNTASRHRRMAVHPDGRVLVPVVSELAKRVPGRRHDRQPLGVPAPTRLRRIQAGPRPQPHDRRLSRRQTLATPPDTDAS
jgi:hypothetical protein